MEREMRKLMQSFIKRFLENIVVDEKTSNKMVDIVKNFENTLIDAVTNKLQEQWFVDSIKQSQGINKMNTYIGFIIWI